MSFDNHSSGQHSSPHHNNDNPELDALNHLDGLGDLASSGVNDSKKPNLGNMGKDAGKLNRDLAGMHGGKNLGNLGKTLKGAGKLNKDAGNPLAGLNNFSGDLGQPKPAGMNSKKDGKDANQDFANLANPSQKPSEDPRALLNNLGTVGSLATPNDKGDFQKPKKASLNDLNKLNNDLRHPNKIKNPVGDLKAMNDLKNGGLGSLGFGPLEGPAKKAAQEGFGHDPLMDKVANGSIQPGDLNDPRYQQRQRDNNGGFRPPKSLFDRFKSGAHKAGRAVVRGAKSAISHTSQGIVAGVKALTGKTIAATIATKAAIVSMTVPLLVGGGVAGVVFNNYNDYQVLDDGNVCAVANTNGSGFADADAEGGSSHGGGSGDFKSNPTAKKHAKAVFMGWVKQGLSGIDAAGIVGWVNSEGGFGILDRAEGHYGNDEKGNGIAYGVAPIDDHGGGGGIYQFTPYTKFASLNDKKWLSGSAQDAFVMKSLRQGDWNPADDLTGKNRSLKEWAKSSTPEDACLGWNAYERGASWAVSKAKGQKVADAKTAYRMFHGSQYKLRESMLGNLAGGTADLNAAVAEKVNDAICKAKGGSGGPVVAGKWGWPYPGFKKSDIGPDQDFGPRSFGWHDGIDIGTATHTGAIHAIHGGKVVEISCKGSTQNDLGYNIVVQSPDGWSEVYQEFAFSMADGKRVSKVKEGDSVKTGQVICYVKSSTPNCTHIHIGVYHGSGKALMSEGWSHSFTPNYPGWKDPIKVIEKGLG